MQNQFDLDEHDDIELWNQEDAAELNRPKDINQYNIIGAARDWTVETIVKQIEQGSDCLL